jgi:chromosome segregation ATPase
VIDALLFVFGKKAAQIRLKKMTELIHKSAAHPNLRFCEVTIHFQLVTDHAVRSPLLPPPTHHLSLLLLCI